MPHSLTFWELSGYFFYCGHLSSAQLDRWQAPKQQPIINWHPVEQIAYWRDIKDNGYKSVFTNSWLVRQRNRSCIKGLGKNPQKSELIHWRQCLLSEATEPCPLGLRATLACIHVIPHNVTPRVKTSTNPGLYGIRCELVNIHKQNFTYVVFI